VPSAVVDYRFQIAQRYLASSKEISLISVITGISTVGVTLGVAALIVVLSVMNGFYDLVRDLMVSIDPHVRITSTDARGVADVDSLVRLAMEAPHVESASAYVEGKGLLVHDGSAEGNQVILVRGVDPSQLRGNQIVQQMGMGNFDVTTREGTPGLVVSMRMAQRLGLLPDSEVRTGSTVGLLSAPALERTVTQLLGAPPIRRFEVRGLYELQAGFDESHVFTSLDEAQRLFRMPDRVTGVELRLDDLQHAQAVKQQLQARLDADSFVVETWYDLKKSLYDVMQLEKWGASAILMLIVLVAAFNIVGSLTMVVIQKRRDVGVLQAMGVSRKDIRAIFLAEGLFIGVLGTGVGLALGLGLVLLQKYFELVPMAQAESFLIDAYPVSVLWTDVVLVAAIALGLCVLASLYPAARAAAIEPAQAIQMDR
jgi:lipoprotein-releasing system permease protein